MTAPILTVEQRRGMLDWCRALLAWWRSAHRTTSRQRGNNRQQVYFSNSQRRTYLALLAEHAARHELRILGYCLMPNHVHAVVVPGGADSMAKGFGRAHNAYSRYLNTVRGRSGHLWQNRFYSAPLDRSHLEPVARV